MFGSLPQPAFMPCPACGASVPPDGQDVHVCDEAQRTAYEVLQARIESDRFEGELTQWLETPAGRFAVFYAARERRLAA